MIYHNDYYYYNSLRWSLIWPSPNFAAAFVTQVFILARALDTPGRIGLIGAGISSFAAVCLVNTFSRGCILGAIAGLLYLCYLRRRTLGRVAISDLFQLYLLILLLFISGNFDRISAAAVGVDKSATNRLEVWKGATEMISASPFVAWNRFGTGYAYCNWFQDLSHREHYATMVNSYLEFAGRYGILPLTVALSILLFLLLPASPSCSATHIDVCRAVLLSWAIANLFTTLYEDWTLWVLPTTAIILILINFRRSVDAAIIVKRCAMCLSAAAGICLSIIIAGKLYSKREKCWIKNESDTVVDVSNREFKSKTDGDLDAELWVDPRILNEPCGHIIRYAVASLSNPATFRVYPFPYVQGATSAANRTKNIILIGSQWASAKQPTRDSNKRVWIVHPLQLPTSDILNGYTNLTLTVVLPHSDIYGTNDAWRDWAVQVGAKLVYSSASSETLENQELTELLKFCTGL